MEGFFFIKMFTKPNFIAAICISFLIWLSYLIYSSALSAEFSFDDFPNLTPLESIQDTPSALNYIFSGNAGPLGRPIALASLAFQHYLWPSSPEGFLRVNFLVHLINGLLVAWFGIRLTSLMPDWRSLTLPFAVTLCGLWTLQPLLASTSLMVVQRMTSLSATFMLAGLVGYLAGRGHILRGRTLAGSLLMITSMVLATVLSALCKETGAMLPIFIWVLESTLLASLLENKILRIWKRILLLPLIALAVYTALQLPHLFEETQRGYSPYQRLLTEGKILWIYLRLMLLPRSMELGPYHDDLSVSSSIAEDPTTLLAWLAWFALGGAALVTKARRPWFSFAIGWFMLGHVLESTLFNLELYFEHRNYMPSLGPLAALSALVWHPPEKYRTAKLIFLAAYLSLLAFVLREVTIAWGNPELAAHLWSDKHPNSERALQFLSQRFSDRGDHEKALAIIHTSSLKKPMHIGFAMQSLQLSCYLRKDVGPEYKRILPILAQGGFSYAVLDALHKTLNMYAEGRCPSLTAERIHALIDTLLTNSWFQGSNDVKFNLYHAKARIYASQGEFDLTVQNLEQAFAAKSDLETAVLIIGTLESGGLHLEALEHLKTYKKMAPLNPFLNQQWLGRLNILEASIARTNSAKSSLIRLKKSN